MSKTNKNTMDMTHGTLWNKILIFCTATCGKQYFTAAF